MLDLSFSKTWVSLFCKLSLTKHRFWGSKWLPGRFDCVDSQGLVLLACVCTIETTIPVWFERFFVRVKGGRHSKCSSLRRALTSSTFSALSFSASSLSKVFADAEWSQQKSLLMLSSPDWTSWWAQPVKLWAKQLNSLSNGVRGIDSTGIQMLKLDGKRIHSIRPLSCLEQKLVSLWQWFLHCRAPWFLWLVVLLWLHMYV